MSEKDRLYKSPDYAAIIQKESVEIIRMELKSLVDLGHVYYEIFDRLDMDTKLVVIFIDDNQLDCFAEKIKLKVKLKDFDCLYDFKCYARDAFKCFNSRQHFEIIKNIMQDEVEFNTLKQTGVVMDSLFLHDF